MARIRLTCRVPCAVHEWAAHRDQLRTLRILAILVIRETARVLLSPLAALEGLIIHTVLRAFPVCAIETRLRDVEEQMRRCHPGYIVHSFGERCVHLEPLAIGPS